MNVSAPTGLTGSFRVVVDESRQPKYFMPDPFGSFPRTGTVNQPQEFRMWCLKVIEGGPYEPNPHLTSTQNYNLGYSVQLLYDKMIPYPLTGGYAWFDEAYDADSGIFVISCKETMQKWGYDIETGNLVWGPSEAEGDYNVYGQSNDVAYGKILGDGYAGHLYCYDITTGERLWDYEAEGIGYESPYGNYPLSIGAIADEKVYVYSSEHSPTTPLWRGSYLRCIDVNSGEELWKVLNFVSGMALADGRIVAGDWYDQMMYCYGKGPSATTVEAPDLAVPFGEAFMIKGTVTDQSPASPGTAAIADEYMDEWTEYLHKGQPKPAHAVGVSVKLTCYDPNGNYQDIGTTTVDQMGNFGLSWMPPVPGDYWLMAEFEGTESYGSSSASTYFTVGAEPEATPPPATPPPPPPTETYIAGSTVAIIAAIVVLAILLLRKR
jgi:hypothetical protein